MMYTYVMFNSFNEIGVPTWLQVNFDAESISNIVKGRRHACIVVVTKRRLGGHLVQFSSMRVYR